MNTNIHLSERRFQSVHETLCRLREALRRIIVGQDTLIDELITAVLAGGHVLIEGMPGLGKTHLVKGLASSMDLDLSRIQCTPDLMPADITGSEILVHDESGQHRLDFRPGPIFAPVVLVDEINRATPKTQAALLESMQEHQVTLAGKRYVLPQPFWVVATQNPIELEGTYPLPEAQLDRFMFKVKVTYPDDKALRSMIEVSLDDEPADHLSAILAADQIKEIMDQAREVFVSDAVKQATVGLILATHPERSEAIPADRQHIRYGSSPRGMQAMLRSARMHALLQGRAQVAFEDLRSVALPALRHRVLLKMESEMDGIDTDAVLTAIISQCLPER
jgi:MoxR-like ATPase